MAEPDRDYHVPVLPERVLELLAPRPGQIVVDGTVGGGGHARLIAERLAPGGRLVLVDRDTAALGAAQLALAGAPVPILAIHGDFRNMPGLLRERGVGRVSGILLDLGVSSHQLDEAHRGFSFRADAPLDMRLDATQGQSAADLLAEVEERDLARILREYADERWAARISRFVVDRRAAHPVRTTRELADVVCAAIPKEAWPHDIHPATRTFQALRIAVNDELGALRQALDGCADLLESGGRIAIISYHSLEDRIVKQSLIRLSGRCQCPPGLPVCRCDARPVLKSITHKPVVPSDPEVKRNPRARSAKLRVAEKVIAPTVQSSIP